MKRPFILLLVLAASILLTKAQLPETDIYISNVSSSGGKLSFSKPENITNRKGYDNQPCFMPDGNSLLFVEVPDTTQSDIYRYDLKSKKISQVTNTKESEYSPSLSADGKNISVVRVDKDSAQRFYNLSSNAVSNANVITGTDSIGYYCWLNDSSLATFILGDVESLQILNLKTHERRWIASDIGRCMKLSPDKKSMYFVIKQSKDEWGIYSLDIVTYKMNKIISTLQGSEDFTIMPDGSLLMGNKGKLYSLTPGPSPKERGEWKEVGDFSSVVGDFYRLAIDAKGTHLALVAFTGRKP